MPLTPIARGSSLGCCRWRTTEESVFWSVRLEINHEKVALGVEVSL